MALLGGKPPSAQRLLCTAPPKPSGGSAALGLARAALGWAKQNTTVVAVVLGASLVMYGFYRFSVRVMKFFFNVSDKQIFTLGVVGGIIASIFIFGVGYYFNARVSTTADGVYRAALAELRKREAVEVALGGAWRPSGFKGYKIESFSCAQLCHLIAPFSACYLLKTTHLCSSHDFDCCVCVAGMRCRARSGANASRSSRRPRRVCR